ncbi:hypothetical protein [Mycolicibacterium sp. HK-90]|uniref:DUF7159 family protein n=1 Tax=Mycolicibacterium sp. HK-90 TaxID=3056937 RepID=UPI00265A5D1C|nr:hypothetical protein [Mycolicibacterium sp. HK-90]WKG04202.1 hypothetical protein QU592_03540 [Mycolicibacterium sp. HK-90]
MTSRDARLLLVEGARGDGAVIDHDSFDADTGVGVERPGFSEHVVSAVLGTYAAASANGNTVARVALTWTDAVSIEAKLVLDALEELAINNVALVPTADALEAAAEYTVRIAERDSIALCIVEPDVTMLALIGAEREDGTRRLRSRELHGPDEATTVLALRGACDSFPEPIGAVAIAGSAPGVESLVEEVNSVMSRPVVRGDDAALLLGRGALIASVDIVPPERDADTTTGSIFVPRAARLASAPELDEADADAVPKRDPLVRTLTMIVATAVLVLAGSVFLAVTVRGDDGGSPSQASTPAQHAAPLPPAPPPPALILPPNANPAALPAPVAQPQPPNPLLVAALSNPQINAVAKRVLPPAVQAAQTPITVPHTDITLPPLTEVIRR